MMGVLFLLVVLANLVSANQCDVMRSFLEPFYLALDGQNWTLGCAAYTAVGEDDYCWFQNVSSTHVAFDP
jgi:hypothetical protein